MASVKRILNFNVGVLGHIDSGKTSLAKALSTMASTASFDKNPQSRERGITLDLGFSSFRTSIPDHMVHLDYDEMQVTLVDCPGHASLIRTIIGGAQIIDLMMLVVDITKGIQTQTAECLVLGEITCEKMLVVLNKIDLISEAERNAAITKMSKKLAKTLEKTKFVDAFVVPVAAKPGGPDAPDIETAIGIEELVTQLKKLSYLPKRDPNGNLIFAVDHCFSIRGQGTVMTGTVISGKVSVGDVIEIPSMKISRKVKSMQMFRTPVETAMQGDRVGICVTQFDPKLLERGIACTPNALPCVYAVISSMNRIPYFKGSIATKAKFHISLGHETVMAKLHLFGLQNDTQDEDKFDFSKEYLHLEEMPSAKKDEQSENNATVKRVFALLEFEKPITIAISSLVIGSRLDTDIHLNTCRLSFQGKLLHGFDDKNYSTTALPQLKVFKHKSKDGTVERIVNEYEVIGRGLFKKETNIVPFTGLKVTLSTGEEGIIESGFGQSGKIKLRIPNGLKETTIGLLGGTGKKKKPKENFESNIGSNVSVKICLRFKRYVYDVQNKIIQT